MTTDLLTPRIKIINDWPGVAGKAIPGTIIVADEEDSDMFWIDGEPFLIDKIRDYPYLFKELPWWSDRDVKDMPEFVKIENKIIPVKKWFIAPDSVWLNVYYPEPSFTMGSKFYPAVLPASESDYNEYLKANQ